MSRPQRILPPDEWLLEKANEGLTYPQIAEAANEWNRYRHGEGWPVCTDKTVNTQLRRLGFRRFERHSEMLPWRLGPQHKHLGPARYLRTLNAIKNEKHVGDRERWSAEAWAEKLRERDAVVHYARPVGFIYLQRPADVPRGSLILPLGYKVTDQSEAA